ncbi:MAG TPA: LysM peptidoglycan-binding domain-containing protein [Terriglobales bacterium]|nr:LysM peptidoglycan-binding domain-containing protein [Terriglobales bacterium]
MPINGFVNFGDIKGESTDDKHKDWIEVAQVGENSLSQVAGRLGIDHGALQAANPQIKDPSNLKVGQEIHIPTHPTPRSESSIATSPLPSTPQICQRRHWGIR